ncbi:MAG: FG-GAP repeat protein [Leptospiraceae bacterium]|nr:FG-GAP repeat protein [Leptospiraceae bacterium]
MSGTPTTAQAPVSYTITASNSSGNATTIISITISGWVHEAYLKASNGEGTDQFGYSAAISADTIVVGATNESSNQTTITNGTTASADNSAGNSGAAYVFKRTGTTWVQEAYLKAPNANGGDQFGINVSISGDTIVVGAWQEDSNQTTITNGTTASSDNSLSASGAAYVFKRTGSIWAQEAYLKAPNAGGSDYFGLVVSISEDTIVVGAPYEDSNQTTITNGTTASADNSAGSSGAAYVFKRTGTTWAQEAYLKAPNADGSDGGDFFGSSVSISGDTIVVGAWREDSNQTTITNGTTATGDNSRLQSGAAYVFKRTGSTWAQEAYLKAPNAGGSDNFGRSVSISTDTIVVGAYGEDSNQTAITNGTTASTNNSAGNSGAAYVFRRY